MSVLEKLFNPAARGSTVKREMLAGLTSFMAMCYLIFVVPGMLADAGMPRDSAVASTIWVTILATPVSYTHLLPNRRLRHPACES